MDTELFTLAVRAASELASPGGIGTLAEYRLHAALKYYVQPDPELHEIKRGGFFCDAVSGNANDASGGVFEIQTRSFERLRRKLEKLLSLGTVTVIYPIVKEKMIINTDPETGELNERKSPKKKNIYSVFDELYKIRDFIPDSNFRLRLISVGASEVRIPNTEPPEKRYRRRPKTYQKAELIPTELFDDVTLSSVSDYKMFIPDTLPEVFFSSDLADAAKLAPSLANKVLYTLTNLSVTERIGRSKSGYLYTLKKI